MAVLGTFVFPHPPLIIEEIGRGLEKKIQHTIDACEKCAEKIVELKPDTIVLASPHVIQYMDYFHISNGSHAQGDFSNFNDYKNRIEVSYDEEFVHTLSSIAKSIQIPAGVYGEKDKNLDHGTMVPLYFINALYKNYKLVRMGLSGLTYENHYQMGICIKHCSELLKKNIVFIASGDLSHKLLKDGPNGYSKEGAIFDRKITDIFRKGNFLELFQFHDDLLDEVAQCGLTAFLVMAGVLDGKRVESNLLSYEGPFGVGYSVASFIPLEEDESRKFLEQYLKLKQEQKVPLQQQWQLEIQKKMESIYVKLARNFVEEFVTTGKVSNNLENIPAELLERKAGVFVSIKKKEILRGCIGTILPLKDSILEEIKQNAISAASNDTRFLPIKEEELKDLVYSVDILTEPELIDTADKLDVKKYGVIVMNQNKMGVLLPDLPDITSIDQQIQIAMKKAEIGIDEKIDLARFEVMRYE